MIKTTTILILAESCHNLVERYTPLVDEIRTNQPEARIVGIFAGYELGAQRIEDDDLFSKTHFFASPEDAIPLLTDINHQLLIIFINHNMTFRDSRLYYSARKATSRKAVILRNRINLQKFFATGCDDENTIGPRVADVRREHAVIQLKTFLLSILVWITVFLARLFRFATNGRNDKKKRVLFIKLDVLGDMIVTLPYIAALRETCKDVELTVLASGRGAGILREQNPLYEHGLCDRLLIWDAPWHIKFPKILGFEELVELVRRLPMYWNQRYDIVIQPVNFGTGIVFALLTLGKRVLAVIDSRLPLAMRLRHLVSDPVDVHQDKIYHMKDWAELVLSRLGVIVDPEKPGLIVDAHALDRVKLFVEQQGFRHGRKLFLFNVGAGHPLRIWGALKFAELATQVSTRHNAMIVLTGSEAERALATEIESLSTVPLINLIGQFSLNELIALTSIADLMVTVDTGTMHLAAALETPLVAIFGAGLVDSCRPLNRNHIIVKEELGCSGCADRCFVSGYPPCLDRVTVSQVHEALEMLLEQQKSTRRMSR